MVHLHHPAPVARAGKHAACEIKPVPCSGSGPRAQLSSLTARRRQQQHSLQVLDAAQQRSSTPQRQPPSQRRVAVRCAASGGSGAAAEAAPEQLPQSREEAIEQAAGAIAAQLAGKKQGGRRGFSGGAGTKFSVEIPVLDDTPAGMLGLAQDLVAALPSGLRQQVSIVSTSDPAAAAAARRPGGAPVLSLAAAAAQEGGVLLVAGPRPGDLGELAALLAMWSGTGMVLLNPGWDGETPGVPPEQAAFAGSFESLYCFLPLSIKVSAAGGLAGRLAGCLPGGRAGWLAGGLVRWLAGCPATPASLVSGRRSFLSRCCPLWGGCQLRQYQYQVPDVPTAPRPASPTSRPAPSPRQAFIVTQEGAVFRWVRRGSPGGTPWRIFAMEGRAWTPVARMDRRPGGEDIEAAFYNASAAKSPLTGAAKFLGGLMNKDKAGQKKK